MNKNLYYLLRAFAPSREKYKNFYFRIKSMEEANMSRMLKTCRPFLIFIAIITLIVLSNGLAVAKSPLSKNFVKDKYPRIAILVCRMGGAGYSLPSPITLKTNYANRIAKPQSAASFKADKVDVYIDDEQRLKESIPDYPRLAVTKVPKYEAQYFRNITPQIYQTVNTVITGKGYQATDLRQASTGWETPFSEMTVNDICTRLKGMADALLVLHYTDCGDSSIDTVKMVRVQKGFSSMFYRVAMFDVQSGERLLDYEVTFGMNVQSLMLKDPQMKEKDRIETISDAKPGVTFERGFSIKERGLLLLSETTANVFHFTDDEIVQYAMDYLRNGYKDDIWDITGLEKLIP
jgi:hypothetical protein